MRLILHPWSREANVDSTAFSQSLWSTHASSGGFVWFLLPLATRGVGRGPWERFICPTHLERRPQRSETACAPRQMIGCTRHRGCSPCHYILRGRWISEGVESCPSKAKSIQEGGYTVAPRRGKWLPCLLRLSCACSNSTISHQPTL